MDLGIVSDTHDNMDVVHAAVETFESADVDTVVHCGDFVAPFSAAPFEGAWDFYAVRGNNDGEWALQDAVETFGTYLGEMGEVTLGGAQLAIYHGTSEPVVDALCACGSYDYVVHGHTHRRAHEDREGTVRLNPGGIAFEDGMDGPAAVLIDLDDGEVAVHDIG